MLESIKLIVATHASQARLDVPGNLAGAPTDGEGVLVLVLNLVYMIAGLAAVISMVMGGFWYVMSNGDPAKVQRGKNAIIYSSIGIVVILMAFGITGFVTGRIGV